MKALMLLFVFLAFSRENAYAGGSTVGNGGDTLFCTASSSNPLRGYYFLDYVVEGFLKKTFLLNAANWKNSLEMIRDNLQRKTPSLSKEFENYLQSMNSTSPNREWKPAYATIVDIKDEKLGQQIPMNCLKISPSRINRTFLQTVVRRQEGVVMGYGGKVIPRFVYFYDPRIISELSKADPYQLSFLYVHEWLWDYLSDAESVRKVNFYLHSQRSLEVSPEQFKMELRSLGLYF